MFNKSVNKVMLVGGLGKDPETRYTQSGSAVCNFSIATSESWKNKTTGEYDEKTEWHNVVVFGAFSELVGKHLTKGAKVYVEGKLQTSKWQGEDGKDRYKTEIIASDIQLLDSKSNGASQSPQQSAPSHAPQRPAPAYQPPAQQEPIQMTDIEKSWVSLAKSDPNWRLNEGCAGNQKFIARIESLIK